MFHVLKYRYLFINFSICLVASFSLYLPAHAWSANDFTPALKRAAIKTLSAEQRTVTQDDGTEAPFHNEYWNNHEAGIYVDVVSGEPLFSSQDKFNSGTGWPSFTKPLVAGNVTTKVDHGMIIPRTEVRSKYADSHLGHVFDDGPAPTGLRYCMDSASLRFIPVKDLEKSGYGEFAKLFKK